MSIQGPASNLLRGLAGMGAVRPAAPKAAERANAGAEAAEPAAAAESSLWELFTSEERDFFTQQAALGSVTYRPARAATAGVAAPTGQRLDVRG